MTQRQVDNVGGSVIALFFILCFGFLVHSCNQDLREEQQRLDRLVKAHAKYDHDIIVTEKVRIYSLAIRDNIEGSYSSTLEGSFFLGSGVITGDANGSITQVPVYYFYVDDGKGGFILRRVDAETTSLHYTKPNENPHLVFVTKRHFDFEHGVSDAVQSTTLVVPANYKLLGQFSKEK